MKYFIADTHFTEESIIRYESRPFQSVQEMDRILVERWNSAVAEEDEVFMLGDFGAVGREAEFLGRLQGRKFLVKGNHDRKSNQYYRLAGFEEVYDHPVIIEGFWILSHEPLYVNSHMPYGNLFGHVHNSPIFRTHSTIVSRWKGRGMPLFPLRRSGERFSAESGKRQEKCRRKYDHKIFLNWVLTKTNVCSILRCNS